MNAIVYNSVRVISKIMRYNSLLFLIFHIPLILECQAENSTPQPELSWNFDNGSLGSWAVNGRGEIVLSHAPRSGEIWYYFRIDNVAGKTLTFVFPNARNDYYGGESLPFISYDQVSWSTIKDRLIVPDPNDPSRIKYSFTHTFVTDRAWIAYTPPFTNLNLDKLITEISSHPHVKVHTVCETPSQNLSIPLIEITDSESNHEAKQSALFLAREDAYESASSWMADGIIHFLLSDDPVAAEIKRRLIVYVIPIFDCNGVALGNAIHPVFADGANVYWTETWPETSYSFYEQRQLKRFIQTLKDGGLTIDYSFRLHSNGWSGDCLRREHCSKDNQPVQDALFNDLAGKQYLPWYSNLDQLMQETRFSKFIVDLFPNAITGYCQSDWMFSNAFGLNHTLFKSTDDLKIEGELSIRALGEQLGVPGSDPPPYLHAAEFYRSTGNAGESYHVRCVYRDLLERPPVYVRVLVNGKSYELTPVSYEGVEPNFQTGVLYTGFLDLDDDINTHIFTTSNGSREFTIPAFAPRTGPLVLSELNKK